MSVDKINKLIGVSESYQAPDKLMEIMLDKPKREKLFRRFLSEYTTDVDYDWFRDYFEQVQADRKQKKQDFTPNAVSEIAHKLVDEQGSYFEAAAGTGGMLVKRWVQDRNHYTPFNYYPHLFMYQLEELGDSAIPFLLFNIAIRGMNATVFYGDSLTRKCKQIFFIQNDEDNFLGFSSVNVMPRTKAIEREFNIKSWADEKKYPPLDHVESEKVIVRTGTELNRNSLKMLEIMSRK